MLNEWMLYINKRILEIIEDETFTPESKIEQTKYLLGLILSREKEK